MELFSVIFSSVLDPLIFTFFLLTSWEYTKQICPDSKKKINKINLCFQFKSSIFSVALLVIGFFFSLFRCGHQGHHKLW